ncbi:hypothetical protein AAVH_37818 [Aphelenchoides avenae]|nr:hypothetical protein AAVH_37818 [Aphelenchus avenae]
MKRRCRASKAVPPWRRPAPSGRNPKSEVSTGRSGTVNTNTMNARSLLTQPLHTIPSVPSMATSKRPLAASHRTEQEDAASEHPSARSEHGDHHSEPGSELHQSEQHISPEPDHVISSEHSEHSAHFEPEHDHVSEEHDRLHADEEPNFPSPREETPRSIPDTAASAAPHESPRAESEAESQHGHHEDAHVSPVQSHEEGAPSPAHNASAMPQPEADESGHESPTIGYGHEVSAIPAASSNRLRLPSQPSIEITPASEYGGSAEDIDRLADARTPLDSDSVREEDEHAHGDHKQPDHDQVVPEHHSNGVEHTHEDDLVSSSPVHENGHTNGLHHQHHGHNDDEQQEETHEKSSLLDRHSDNEDNESTGSIIIHDGKGSNGGYHRLPTDGEVGGSEI